jgi:hypothetical protein
MKPVEIITSYFGLLVRTQGPTGFPFEVLCLILVHLVLLKRCTVSVQWNYYHV